MLSGDCFLLGIAYVGSVSGVDEKVISNAFQIAATLPTN